MQIALTNTLLASACAVLACLTACDSAPIGRPTKTVAERLALLEEECGFTVGLPTISADLEALFEQNRAHTYISEVPLGGPYVSSGDNVFPIAQRPEFSHGEVVSAIVVICPGEDPMMVLGARSPRFAFYIDENGKVFHVEDHSLYTGP